MKPISRRVLIQRLKGLGFSGPAAGSKHAFMQRGKVRVTIPNPHGAEISGALLMKILRDAKIGAEEWDAR